MRAMFLERRYVEKSKKSGRSMTILSLYKLPELKSDGSGELVGSGLKEFFVMDSKHFDLGKNCKFGDIVDVRMEYDERFDRGTPTGIEIVKESPFDLMSLIGA